MKRYHLTINIYNNFFEWKLDNKGKINSIWFYDYDLFFEKVLQGLDYSDLNKFRLNLFNMYKSSILCVKTSLCDFEWVKNWYTIINQIINVSSDSIARCIPSRKVRDKFFEYDCLREKYYIRTDFIFYLKW